MNFPAQTRNRIQNMAVFFVANCSNVNRMKLNKLFYFADKLAIERTAFSISEQQYFADVNGPVPVSTEIERNIIPAFSLTKVIRENGDGIFGLRKGVQFDDSEFSGVELSVLAETSTKFKQTTGEAMSALSHEKGEPWDIVWDNGRGQGAAMPLDALLERNLPPEEKEKRKLLREDVEKANRAFRALPGFDKLWSERS